MEGVDAAYVSDTETVCYCVFYDLCEIILGDGYFTDMIFKAYHRITPLLNVSAVYDRYLSNYITVLRLLQEYCENFIKNSSDTYVLYSYSGICQILGENLSEERFFPEPLSKDF